MADKYDAFLDAPVSGSDKYDTFLDAPAKKPVAAAPVAQEPAPISGFIGSPNLLGGVVEPLAKMGTGLVGKVAGDIAGLGTVATSAIGLTDTDPRAIKAQVEHALTYEPRTAAGRSNWNPLNAIPNGIGYVVGGVSNGAANLINPNGEDATTLQGGAANLVREAIPQSLGFVGVKGVPKYLNPVQYVAGKTADLVTGNASKVRAANLLRKVAGDTLPTVERRLGQAGQDTRLTASQVVGDGGTRQFSALGELSKKYAPDEFGLIQSAQDARRGTVLSDMAGGPSQEASLLAQMRGKTALNNTLDPLRTENLNAANLHNEVSTALNPVAELYAGNAGKYAHSTNGASTRVNTPADQALYQAAADTITGKIGTLESNGLKPLTGNSIVSAIDGVLAKPGTRGAIETSLLTALKGELQRLADLNGGTLNAFDLHNFRKQGINNAVESLLSGRADASGIKSHLASKVLPGVKTAIDDAIEQAGGTGWRSYLNRFSMGMHEIDRQRMAAAVKDMSPDQVIDLAKGNNPAAVESVFGPGNFSLQKEMGASADQIVAIGRQLERDKMLSRRADEGAFQLQQTLGNHAMKFRLPFHLSPKAAVVNRVLDISEHGLNARTMNTVAQAMTTPAKALDLIRTLPAAERIKAIRLMSDPSFTLPAGYASVQSGMLSGDQK